MNPPRRTSIDELYRTDLERHLFAPGPQSEWRSWQLPELEALTGRLRDWFGTGWKRWKFITQATNLL